VNGSSCATEGQACSYEFCGRPGDMRFVCTGGRWTMQSVGSCNPPPPQMCPPSEPMLGSACFVSPIMYCTYSTCCPQSHAYACNGGIWGRPEGADAGACVAPPPACPADPPLDGAPCCFNAPMTGSCMYACRATPDAGGFSSADASCDGTQWRVLRDTCSVSTDVPLLPDRFIDDAGSSSN
jgi:hypothetical protein